MPCINDAFELCMAGRAESVAFDFQSRRVGHNRGEGSLWNNFRSKDHVNNHEHGRVNSDVFSKEQPHVGQRDF